MFQEPTTSPYCEPNESKPQSYTLQFFGLKSLYAFLFSPISITFHADLIVLDLSSFDEVPHYAIISGLCDIHPARLKSS
jgi:hypothetical protein